MPFANGEFALDLIPDGDSFKVGATGLARSLAFRDAADLVRSIPDGEKGYELVRTPGGMQTVWMLTEAGFYRALGQRQAARISDERQRAAVERFQAWVYGEVLPSLRQVGSYSMVPQFEIPSSFAEALELAAKQTRRLEEAETRALAAEHHAMELAPAAYSWDVLNDTGCDMDYAQAAQVLDRDPSISMGRDRLFRYTDSIGWTYKHGKQRRRPYQAQVDLGRLTSRMPKTFLNRKTQEEELAESQIGITPKGLLELHRLLGGSQPLQYPQSVPA